MKLSIVAGVLVLMAAVLGISLLAPPPPRRVRIATGAEEGMYIEAARRYQEILARARVRVDVVPTSGSLQNVGLLQATRDGVDLAFVQGGTVPSDPVGLHSLGSVFFEPLWVFVRASAPITRLAELRGRRVAVGVKGSGTRALTRQLLEVNGIRDEERFLDLGGPAAVKALLDGTADAAFFVTAKPLPLLEPLLRARGVDLVSLSQVDAYTRRYPYLSKVVLPAGALDLAANIPAQDITLLAPAAALMARDDIHPAVVDLIMAAATETHGGPQLFAASGLFPSPHFVDVPLSPDAQRWFRSGPTFLRRHLPFWGAAAVEQLLLLVPVVAIGVPIFNFLPRIMQARFARRIHRAYGRLRALEVEAAGLSEGSQRQRVLEQLDAIEDDVCRLGLPANQIERLYQLRTHIDFLRRALGDYEGRDPARERSARGEISG
jgi:TRAP transporter TAXI family solute receptor